MARPLRIQFPDAIYHVTSRGDRREDIVADDTDRQQWLDRLGHALERFDAQALAFCLMGNHYHLVVHTRQANLSQLMRQINGVYTQDFNRRHGQVGHLFQGRFKAILVDRDAYLLEVCRYVELNPVRAHMVQAPQAWPWSSYRANAGLAPRLPWLATESLYSYLLAQPIDMPIDAQKAAERYAAWVAAGSGMALWAGGLRQQIYLGDEDFVARMQQQADSKARGKTDVPKAQRHIMRTWPEWLAQSDTREQAMVSAYRKSGMSMTHIAKAAGLSVSRVSRLIAAEEAKGKT